MMRNQVCSKTFFHFQNELFLGLPANVLIFYHQDNRHVSLQLFLNIASVQLHFYAVYPYQHLKQIHIQNLEFLVLLVKQNMFA